MKCSRPGCSAEATHAPKICVPLEAFPDDDPLSAIIGLPLCSPDMTDVIVHQSEFLFGAASPVHHILSEMADGHGSNLLWEKSHLVVISLDGDEWALYLASVKASSH